MHELIYECRRNFGVDRRFSLLDRWFYLHVKKPAWLEQSRKDELHVLFENLSRNFSPMVWLFGDISCRRTRSFGKMANIIAREKSSFL